MDIFWENEGWEESDRHLKKVREMPFQRPIPFIPTAAGLYVVRGPRQIGKSSWLKEVLSHYSRLKESCFYLSCEEITDYRELIILLDSLSNRKVVLLDEISFVPNWDRAVKHAIDSGKTNILMVTGSHAYDIKSGADRLPGRFDGGGEFALLPMEFQEFWDVRKSIGWAKPDRLSELKAFFRVGGFPTAVAEGGPEAKKPKKAIETYWRWLAGDMVKLGKQEIYLTELLTQIASILQTPTSLQNLAAKASIGSHTTVQEYIAALEACFAVRTLFAIDIDTGAFRFKKNRKLYFSDPLLYWMTAEKGGLKEEVNIENKLAEQVAHESLARKYQRFGYFSNKSGEIDFILPKQWAIEVKWSPVATNISMSYTSLVVPWKTVWTQETLLTTYPLKN